ncbi:MAG: sigma-70 family RNA polymerase sigma factor [Gemmatimonadota bacterium]
MSDDVTHLIHEWRAGDPAALDRLVPLVYAELKGLADQRLRRERPDHTFQPTALVHEAYARLVDAKIDYVDRAHFFAVIARTMRSILVDHARARSRQKRGGGAVAMTLDEQLAAVDQRPEEFLALDEALERLAEQDPRKARVVELHYFGGLNYEEVAAALELSTVTVFRDLRFAKAWLADELGPDTVLDDTPPPAAGSSIPPEPDGFRAP